MYNDHFIESSMYSIWHADFNSDLSSHNLLPYLIVINAMNYSGLFKVCEQVMAD